MRTDLGWALDPGRHVPQPRLVRGVPGAGPRGPARAARPTRAPAGHVPRPRAARSPRRSPRARRGVPRRRPGRARLRAERHDRRRTRCSASLRFEPGDELLTDDHEYNATLNALAGGRGARRRSRRRVSLPFPIRHPRRPSRRCSPRSRPGRASRRQPRDEPERPRPADRAARPRARRAAASTPSSTGARAGHGAARRSTRSAPRTAPATATSGCAARRAPAFLWVRADRRDRRPPDGDLATAPTTRAPTDRASGSSSTGRARATRPRFLSLPGGDRRGWRPRSPAAGRRIMAANHALALDGRDRLAAALGVEPPAPDDDARLDGVAAAARRARRTRRPPRSTTRSSTRTASRCRSPAWPGPRRPRVARTTRRRAVLVRVSAQRYNEPVDYDRLASALARRLTEA